MREKYCWLAGGWRLVLELCERKILLAGWRNQTANKSLSVLGVGGRAGRAVSFSLSEFAIWGHQNPIAFAL